MIYLLIFLAEILLLFLLSRLLSRDISQLLFQLTQSQKITTFLLAILFLPGTVIHELAHAGVALLSFVKVGKIEFMPETLETGSIKLGSAQIAQTDPLRRALIGVAPIFIGIGLIFSLIYLFLYQLSNLHSVWWVYIALGILTFEISNTMFSSKKDMEGMVWVMLVLSGLLLVLYLLLQERLTQFVTEFLSLTLITGLLQKSVQFLAVPIVLDVLILLGIKLTLKRKLVTNQGDNDR